MNLMKLEFGWIRLRSPISFKLKCESMDLNIFILEKFKGCCLIYERRIETLGKDKEVVIFNMDGN